MRTRFIGFIARLVTVVFALVLTLGALSVSAKADTLSDWDQRTMITVNVPWQVPGTTLPAGTYVIRLANTWGTRTVVEILNKDETKLYATVIAATAYRPRSPLPQPPMFHFNEAKEGAPAPLHTWYYPGQPGIEFMYRKS